MKMAGNQLHELLRRGESLRWERKFQEAAVVFAEAVRLAEVEGEPVLLADALEWLAIAQTLDSPESGALADALVLQTRAVSIMTTVEGERSVRVAGKLRTLAMTMIQLGRREEAVKSLESAVAIFRESGVRSLSFEGALAMLANLLCENGNFEAAVAAGGELVELCEQLGSGYERQLTEAHFRLGRALVGIGRGPEAIVQLEKVLDLAAPRIATGKATRLTAEVEQWLVQARALVEQG